MVSSTVSAAQRFRRYGEHCPICQGHSGLKQGRGERCAGYISKDGEYAYCTREEHAGNLSLDESTQPPAFCHKLYGQCNCGVIHNPERGASNGHKSRTKKDQPQSIVAEYSYLDERGRLAYVTVRYEPKDFKQKRPDGKGGWLWNLQGVNRIPYRLPELLKAPPQSTIYITEGEKAADAAAHLGVVATTSVGGALNWTSSCNKYFKGHHVVILPDNDDKGRAHAKMVAKELTGIAASVRIIELPDLPEKGDIVEWIAAGGTKELLEHLCKPPKRKFTYASEITPKKYQWIWEDRIAIGEFTLGVGDAGVGKGLTISKIIAHVTNGSPLPGDTQLFPGGVILMSPEESEEHSIVPRLIAAGANRSKVLLLNKVDETDPLTGRTYKRPVSFPEDTSILIEAIEDAKGALIVIDPVLSLLSDKVDAHRNHAVRRAVGQVLDAARENGCALLGIMHTTKTQHPNVLFRSSSSSAFIEMARASLFFVPDPDGEPGQSGVIVNYKNNMRRKAPHIRYAIHQSQDNIGYITWEGISLQSEEELLNQEAPVSNAKSAQEIDLVTILKANSVAMTVSQLLEKVQNGQAPDALERMLRRKVEQGILMRPARGLYTYAGNHLYGAQSETTQEKYIMSDMSEMSDVRNVRLRNEDERNGHETDNVRNKKVSQHAPEEASQETDISDMDFVHEIVQEGENTPTNGHHAAPQALRYDVESYLARLPELRRQLDEQSVKYRYPKRQVLLRGGALGTTAPYEDIGFEDYLDRLERALRSDGAELIQQAVEQIDSRLARKRGEM